MPKLGYYDHKCLIGPLRLNLDDLMPTATYHGLVPTQLSYWGSFAAKDGTRFILLRTFVPGALMGLAIFSNRDGQEMQLCHEVMEAYNGAFVTTREGDQLINRSVDYVVTGSARHEYRQSLTRAHWREEGLLELDGEVRDASFQWYDPDPASPMAYTTHMHRARGTILGTAVDGWFGNDWTFGPPGVPYFDSGLYTQGIELAWMAIANDYEDGSWDIGLIGKGQQRWGFFIRADDQGGCALSTNVDAHFSQHDDGYPKDMHFRITDDLTGAEEIWDLVADPGSKMVDIPKLWPQLAHWKTSEASLTRRGDTRIVKRGMAWHNFHDDGRVQAWRDAGGEVVF